MRGTEPAERVNADFDMVTDLVQCLGGVQGEATEALEAVIAVAQWHFVPINTAYTDLYAAVMAHGQRYRKKITHKLCGFGYNRWSLPCETAKLSPFDVFGAVVLGRVFGLVFRVEYAECEHSQSVHNGGGAWHNAIPVAISMPLVVTTKTATVVVGVMSCAGVMVSTSRCCTCAGASCSRYPLSHSVVHLPHVPALHLS